MAPHIAFLRAVNLPTHNKVAMTDLRALAEALGFSNARTLLQSGNLVFDAGERSVARIEARLEAEAKRRLKLDTAFFVRTANELEKVIGRNPFPVEAKRDPSHVVVMFMKEPLAARNVSALQDAIVGREVVRGDDRHLYVVYPDGIGRSKLTTALMCRKLGAAGTGRNWNTVLACSAALSAPHSHA